MTSPRPPLPPAQTSPVNQDKLNKIKRKLKETLEVVAVVIFISSYTNSIAA
jgi:hypothetical protein